MSYAEEAAEEFKEDIETACNSADFPFILCLLQADEKAEEIVNTLEQAYEAMEEVCQNIKDKTMFSELITDNIMSYISHQDQCVYSDIDDKVQELKKQITKRELLKAPKFEAWRPMGLTDEDWDQIMAAAEEVQHTDDHKYLEQGEHDEDEESFEDADIGSDDQLIELPNSDIEIELESQEGYY